MRPPGYEPGELPTAPLRDVNRISGEALPFCECKGTTIFPNIQTFVCFFFYFIVMMITC